MDRARYFLLQEVTDLKGLVDLGNSSGNTNLNTGSISSSCLIAKEGVLDVIVAFKLPFPRNSGSVGSDCGKVSVCRIVL